MTAALLALVLGSASTGVVLIVLALLAIGMLLVLAAAASVAGSARVMAGAAREITEGEFAVRVPPGGADELGAALDEFNRMAARLQSGLEEASQERNRLTAALNSSVDAVIAVDEDSNVTFANSAVRGLLDRAPEDVVGRPFVWVMADPEVIQALRDSREEERRSSHVIERPNRRFLQVIVTPIAGGGAWSSLVVLQDVSDMKRVEQVRRDFIANVSHELRTPLAAIKSVIETLDGGAVEDKAVAHDFLGRADAEVDRLVRMVEELLELSRIESGDLAMAREPVDLAAAVSSAVDRLRPHAERQGVALSLIVERDLPHVLGDRDSLERVVVGLLHNAIKFTPEGGAIDVLARADEGGATVEVRDTGVGIEPQDLPRVFERFYKADRARRAGGTGLGLAVVKHTVEAHGGRVAVESQAGAGSVFRFWLPAAEVPAKAAEDAIGRA